MQIRRNFPCVEKELADLKLTFDTSTEKHVVLDPNFAAYNIDWGDNLGFQHIVSLYQTEHDYINGETSPTITIKDISEDHQYFSYVYYVEMGNFNVPYNNFFKVEVDFLNNYVYYESRFKNLLKVEGPIPGNNKYISYIFKDNSKLYEVSDDIFRFNTYAINGDGIFYGCKSLNQVPENIFYFNPNLESLKETFYESGIIQIPEKLFSNNRKLKSVAHCFAYCDNITTVPEDLFSNNNSLIDISYLFQGSRIRTVPEKLFDNLTNITEANYVFDLSMIENIPEKLFDYNTNLINMVNTFSYCDNITSIPAKLFSKLTNLTKASYIFSGCEGITTIPEELFKFNTELENISGAFQQTNITTIPEKLFDYNTKLSNCDMLFYGCKKFTSIPEKLFAKQLDLLSVENCFASTNITSIPEKLFEKNTEIWNFNGCFSDTDISSIPANLFTTFNEVPKTRRFRETFSLTPITEIPSGLFNHILVEDGSVSFESTFMNCANLETIPYDLFHYLDCSFEKCNLNNCLYGTPLYGTRPLGITPDSMFPEHWTYEERKSAFKTLFNVEF